MIEIAVKHLVEATDAKLWTAGADRVSRGVVIDSRKVREDSIFVAFPGERADGNDYVVSAMESGAACVVMTRTPEPELIEEATRRGCAVLTCEDPTEFLLRLAHYARLHMDCTVIAVTGSIGKTTTKDSLAALLSARYRVHVTQGNHNNLIGMPLTILSAPADTEILILEMGMDGFGQIERLSRCAQPTYAVITKIGTSHIGLLGSRENIARAKSEVLSGMAPTKDAGSLLVLNGQDDFTPFIKETFADPAGIDVITCGTSETDDVCARDVEIAQDGRPSFTVAFKGEESFRTRLAVPGAQSVGNALFAIALAYRLGVTSEEISDRLGTLEITGRRTEVRAASCGARVIDDSYNAAPESMAAALDLLSSLPAEGRRIAVLGEMGELGSEGARLHELTGAYAAAKKPDLIACVGGDMAEHMASAARLMGMPEDRVRVFPATDAAIAALPGELASGDLVLVKGSRFVGLDRFVEEVC